MAFTAAFPLLVFVITLILLALEVYDKATITVVAALSLILTGVITYNEALSFIDFSTIFVLIGMIILVDISKRSGFFTWLSVKMTSLSRGNPFYIFLFFCLFSAFFSIFFTNVTAILIMAPITIELVKNIGRDPKPYILGEIFMANIAGSASILGDPANIIIGTGSGLTFNDFIINLLPIAVIIVIVALSLFYAIEWANLKPISKDLKKTFLSQIIIKKIQYKFLSQGINKNLVIKSVIILGLTIIGYILQHKIGISLPIISLTGAFILIILASRQVSLKNILESIQWETLFFFAGLFIIVHSVEKTGLLELISHYLSTATTNFGLLLLIILWGSAFTSMILDNVAFVTVMIPVILKIQLSLPDSSHANLLWFALSLGAVMGGTGTIIGASSNVVGTDIARHHGVNITFNSYLKYALPFTVLALTIASLYLLFRVYYF